MNIARKAALLLIAVAGFPLNSYAEEYSSLDLHAFERGYVQSGMKIPEYEQVQRAVPVGSDAANAVAVLRHAGAHCPSPKSGSTGVNCFYRELLSVDDYVNTYATWDIRLAVNAGKVSAVSVERSTEQHS